MPGYLIVPVILLGVIAMAAAEFGLGVVIGKILKGRR